MIHWVAFVDKGRVGKAKCISKLAKPEQGQAQSKVAA